MRKKNEGNVKPSKNVTGDQFRVYTNYWYLWRVLLLAVPVVPVPNVR